MAPQAAPGALRRLAGGLPLWLRVRPCGRLLVEAHLVQDGAHGGLLPLRRAPRRLGGCRPLDPRLDVLVEEERDVRRVHVVGAADDRVAELRDGVGQPLVLVLAAVPGARGDVGPADLALGGLPVDPEGPVVAADVPRPLRDHRQLPSRGRADGAAEAAPQQGAVGRLGAAEGQDLRPGALGPRHHDRDVVPEVRPEGRLQVDVAVGAAIGAAHSWSASPFSASSAASS